MKILHTADWHIGQFKGPVVDGVNLRSQDTIKCLEYMVEVAQKEKPDIVCISGDIFHQEQIGPVRYSDEMIHATNIITALAHFASYVIVMRGTPNHDGSGQFRVLKRMLLNVNNVCVVTEPFVIKTRYADIACIPGFDKQEFRAKFPGLSADEENLAWTKYISDIVLALRAECENTPILMAHYTVPGCNMESGQTSFFTNFEPVIPRETLMAARYEAVLLGHIHRPQIIEGFDNVFYSGAINAMNFNDEGQDRGFWIHEFNEKGTLVKGHRYTTPYRQFHTITWDPDEVSDYIREGTMYLHRTGISEDVTDKIVRVRYSCTSEQKKALNIPLLQKNLYELGAFYVADIEAESTIDITNRGLLSEESDPRLNLKKWLEEKTFKNPEKIVELADAEVKNRFEIRLKNERAFYAIRDLLEHDNPERTAFQIINRYVRFVDKDDTKPRSDWRISEEWAWFIGEHRGSLKLTTKPEPYSFERTLHWLSHQVAPTLKLALRLDKMNHTQIVHDIITHAKLTEKHEKILKQQAAAAKEVVL